MMSVQSACVNLVVNCSNHTLSFYHAVSMLYAPDQCPLCRFSFSGDFVEGIPSIILEKDQVNSNLVIRLAHTEPQSKDSCCRKSYVDHRFDVLV